VRTIRRAEKTGLLCKDILFCIGYWGSDNPLHGDELIAKNHMGSGALSANALAVAVLAKTLNEGRACHDPRVNLLIGRSGMKGMLSHELTQ
jgi:hypothetical protein